MAKHQKEAVGFHLDLALKRINSQDETISKIMERLNKLESKSDGSSSEWKVNPPFGKRKRATKDDDDY